LNDYAIDALEIGQAMNNASSILAANGNSFEEAMGILTAANTTLQDVSKSSTAVRTIVARISASKTELEELGEDTGSIIATANLDKEMRAYGVSITDVNGELRSTFDILNDLHKKWGDLNTTQRAAIAGLLAGKRVPVHTVMCA
jgi:TP901 family phage tail tape measure protein